MSRYFYTQDARVVNYKFLKVHETYLSQTIRAHTEGYVPRFILLPNDANVAPFPRASLGLYRKK